MLIRLFNNSSDQKVYIFLMIMRTKIEDWTKYAISLSGY